MRKIIIQSFVAAFLMATPAMADEPTKPSANSTITLINVFEVPEQKISETILFWERAAEFMKKQPGYVSTALHQSILPGSKYELINVAQWKNIESFQNASKALQNLTGLKRVQGVKASPSLYKIIRTD